MEIKETTNDFKQYVVVKLDNEQYGIDIAYVDNIVRMQKITRVPKAQEYFVGVINLRGEIIPVMSMRLKFDLPDKEITQNTRIIILKTEQNAKLGLLVDEVKEVVTLYDESIEKISHENSNDGSNFLTGIGKYNETLISLLNINGVINDIDTI